MFKAADPIYEAHGTTGLKIQLKVWAASSSETSVFTYTITHSHNTEDLNLNICRRKTSNLTVVYLFIFTAFVAVSTLIQIM
jgi:hypothetical protein